MGRHVLLNLAGPSRSRCVEQMMLSSLRSHFFKHLSCTTAAFFSISNCRSHHHLVPARFSPISSSQWGFNLMTATKFSTAAFSSDSAATSSFISPYLSVDIYCRKNVCDMLSEALLCFGASSTSMDEKESDENDDEVCITTIFSDCQDVDKCISHAVKSVGLKETPSYKVTKGNHFDWINKSQESFQPVEITKGLWVVPEWRTPPDLQATNIILNPGLAFGTGEHPTSKLCLLLLHGLIKEGKHFLDYGTGSGILAIAAIKFGAALSVGLDVDPQAIRSARQNALLNNIGAEQLQLHLIPSKKSCPTTVEAIPGGMKGKHSSGTKDIFETRYDVVIANILLNPLLDLADHIVYFAKPGAVVGLSGIISEQIPYIVERYSELLEGLSISKLDGWACISGTKKRNLIPR